jgi:proteasome lid subunit RPN8/RPN11
MTNVHETPHNRYSVDPFELMRLEDELDESTELMVGIYHSHPDHPARPSSFDLKYAWPNLLYAVIGVQHGVVEKITVWKLGDKEFAEIMIDES